MISNPDKAVPALVSVIPAGMVNVTAGDGAVKSAASALVPAANDNVTSVSPVSSEEEAPAKAADADAAPAFVSPSPTALRVSCRVMVSLISRLVSTTTNPDAVPVNRIVSGPSATPSSRGVIRASAVPEDCPLVMVIVTVSALRT